MKLVTGLAVLASSTILCATFIAGCGDTPQSPSSPPRPESPPETDGSAGSMLKPLDLVYLCGNKFLATNVYRMLVQMIYRVVHTDESGSLALRQGIDEEPGYSETELETAERGTVELYRDETLVARRKNEGTACGAPSVSFAVTGGDPAESGQWSAPFPWPAVAVDLSLLPSGKVLSWGRATPQLWDPATGSFKGVASPASIFCSGHAFLPDGRLLAAGGHISNDHGHPGITIFSASTEGWTQ